jgi:hypothetical protein
VVAAGNDGTADLHAGASLIEGELVFPVELGKYTDADGVVELELWYSGALDLMVESPGGFRSDWVAPGSTASSNQIVSNHVAEGQIVIDNSGAPNLIGRRNAGVALTGPMGGSPVTGTWKLHVRGQSPRFDAWSVESPPSGAAARFTDRISEDVRVGLPATAHDAIVVGSFVSRSGWNTNDGQTIQRNVTVGNPSSFSSTGPTSDGRFAPDLMAPGEFIVAALSSNTSPNDPASAFFVPNHPNYTWADDGVHAVLRGTSQSAPHVAGACALLLQADPTLDPTKMRELLRVTARPTPVGWSPREGFGKLDVLAALQYLGGKRGAAVDSTASSVGTSRDLVAPGADTFTITVIPRDAAGTPVGAGHAVTIDASEGAPAGDVVDTGWGRRPQRDRSAVRRRRRLRARRTRRARPRAPPARGGVAGGTKLAPPPRTLYAFAVSAASIRADREATRRPADRSNRRATCLAPVGSGHYSRRLHASVGLGVDRPLHRRVRSQHRRQLQPQRGLRPHRAALLRHLVVWRLLHHRRLRRRHLPERGRLRALLHAHRERALRSDPGVSPERLPRRRALRLRSASVGRLLRVPLRAGELGAALVPESLQLAQRLPHRLRLPRHRDARRAAGAVDRHGRRHARQLLRPVHLVLLARRGLR